jgi:UDP:flavonoid glycosyltransferase YjiC (YdhE family)
VSSLSAGVCQDSGVRILVATTAGAGHFGPMIPVARACVAVGHDVLVASPASFASAVAAAGFEHAPFDDVPAEVMGAVFAGLAEVSREEANAIVLGEVFGRLDAQAALPGLSATVGSWRPDVIMRDPCEFASWAVAERSGIAQAEVAIGVTAFAELMRPLLEAPLNELREIAGLGPDLGLRRLRTVPSLSTVPRGFDGSVDSEDTTFRFRDPANRASEARLPGVWGAADDPLVYVSFGSVAGHQERFASLYPAVRDVLANLPYRVLLTTGRGVDPTDIGPWPANIRAEQWWPQAEVMPLASALIGHGGFGTTMIGLAAGVPQVVTPLFSADQFLNARRIAETGVGRSVNGGLANIPDALGHVLTERSYRGAAQRIADEIQQLPDVAEAAAFLQRIAA